MLHLNLGKKNWDNTCAVCISTPIQCVYQGKEAQTIKFESDISCFSDSERPSRWCWNFLSGLSIIMSIQEYREAINCLDAWICCSVAKLCLTLCDPMDCSTPGFPNLHYLLELAKTHVHWVDETIQPSHPLLPPSPPAFNLSQHQGLFQWVGSSDQEAKVLELQH